MGAFTSHYLKLGASQVLGQKNPLMLHKVSPLSSADPDLTWTTGITDGGGNVREGDVQSNGELFLPPFDLREGPPGLRMSLENEPENSLGDVPHGMSREHTCDRHLHFQGGVSPAFAVSGSVPTFRLSHSSEQDFGHYEMSTGHTGDQALSSPSGPNFSFPVRGIPRKRPRERERMESTHQVFFFSP